MLSRQRSMDDGRITLTRQLIAPNDQQDSLAALE